MKLKVVMSEEKRVKEIERIPDKSSWVELLAPKAPDYFLPLLLNYQKGKPISKGIQVIYPSGQQWQELRNDQKAELLELVEWLGGDANQFVRDMEIQLPKDPVRRLQYVP